MAESQPASASRSASSSGAVSAEASSAEGVALSQRKQDHLDICRDQDVASVERAGWDRVRIPHRALPELDMAHVQLEVPFLGRQISSPFLISGMTGGSREGDGLNSLLARFAQDRGLPMGVGSQRIVLVDRDPQHFALRRAAPRALLIANLGAVQFNYGVSVDDARWLVDQLEAQALALHLNPLQEAIQMEGDRNFSGLFEKIAALQKALPVPLILKETGSGLDPQSVLRARDLGVEIFDLAGMGGTHWGFVEGLRNPARRALGEMFRDWGWPTAELLPQVRRELDGYDRAHPWPAKDRLRGDAYCVGWRAERARRGPRAVPRRRFSRHGAAFLAGRARGRTRAARILRLAPRSAAHRAVLRRLRLALPYSERPHPPRASCRIGKPGRREYKVHMKASPKSSRLTGFFKMNRGERLDRLRDFGELPVDQTRVLGQDGALPFELADLFVENAVGSFPLPLGVATSFKVNDKEFVVPMAVEESSVIAAASNSAKLVHESGGFRAELVSGLMIGQIQLLDVEPADFARATADLLAARAPLLQMANEVHPRLLMRGGGAREIEVRCFPEASIPFMVLHILMDTRDAMGANLVNTVCERLAPEVARIAHARAGLRILSNLADRRVFRASCRIPAAKLAVNEAHLQIKGEDVAQRIVEAFVFADHDPYRAATHNKGIMNGIDPVVIATGNDWRAIEAGVHAYAARDGRYRSLTRWSLEKSIGETFLVGVIEVPLQIGTVGGVTRLHPMSKISLHLLGNPNAEELGTVMACAGLASNLAALRALCTTGIQRGHMKLHAKNLALAAGSRGREVEQVANLLVLENRISSTAAEKCLAKLRQDARDADFRDEDADAPLAAKSIAAGPGAEHSL